jgi:hypothetical protein
MSPRNKIGQEQADAFANARTRLRWGTFWLSRIALSQSANQQEACPVEFEWRDDEPSSLEPPPGLRGAPHLRLIRPLHAAVPVVGHHVIAAYAPIAHAIWLGRAGRPNNVVILEKKPWEDLVDLLPKLLKSLGVKADGFSVGPVHRLLPATDSSDGVEKLAQNYANVKCALSGLDDSYLPMGDVRFGASDLELHRWFRLVANASGRIEAAISIGLSVGDDLSGEPFLFARATASGKLDRGQPPPDGWRWQTDAASGLIAPASSMHGLDGHHRLTAMFEAALEFFR